MLLYKKTVPRMFNCSSILTRRVKIARFKVREREETNKRFFVIYQENEIQTVSLIEERLTNIDRQKSNINHAIVQN